MKSNTYGAIAFLLIFVLVCGIIGGMECETIGIWQGILLAIPVLIGAGWCTYKARRHHEKD